VSSRRDREFGVGRPDRFAIDLDVRARRYRADHHRGRGDPPAGVTHQISDEAAYAIREEIVPAPLTVPLSGSQDVRASAQDLPVHHADRLIAVPLVC
jgi:hypothetical protein